MMRGQQDANPPGIAHDGRTDLQQAHPDRGGAGTLQFGGARLQAAQRRRAGQRPTCIGSKLATAMPLSMRPRNTEAQNC
jgi:hypothetical protein